MSPPHPAFALGACPSPIFPEMALRPVRADSERSERRLGVGEGVALASRRRERTGGWLFVHLEQRLHLDYERCRL